MARKVPSINTSSSADISFLLLTFFLLTSNISTDQGILRTLPKWSSNTKQEDVEINTRNLLTVTVNGKNDVIISGAKWSGDNWLVLTDERKHINSTNASNYGGEIDMLHEIAKEFEDTLINFDTKDIKLSLQQKNLLKILKRDKYYS